MTGTYSKRQGKGNSGLRKRRDFCSHYATAPLRSLFHRTNLKHKMFVEEECEKCHRIRRTIKGKQW